MWLSLKLIPKIAMGQRIDNQLLVITGPTSTGKTALAEILAKKYHGNLISADSRQIYRGLDIGTGKDHHFQAPISLIDVVDIDQPFSAYEFYKLAQEIITKLHIQKKLPIVVGGTGHYLQALLNPNHIQYQDFRSHILFPIFNRLPTHILETLFRLKNYAEFSSLNNSEKHNPQRLIKRILSQNRKKVARPQTYNLLHVHLTAPNNFLYQKIDKRIQKRLAAGLIQEITNILKKYHWEDPGLKTIAYQEFRAYFSGKVTLEQAIALWARHEKQYLKRQKTYFAKINPKTIFDITNKNWQKDALNAIDKWYNQSCQKT